MNKMQKLKGFVARVIAGLFLLQCTGISSAATIPTGSISFAGLAPVSASITSATLKKWRTGTTGQVPTTATSMTFQYLGGTSLGYPTRSTVLDGTANNQSDMWSDNVIELVYQKPNNDSTAIVIFTSNTVAGVTGVAGLSAAVSPRGGLVAADGSHMLPLIWKALDLATLQANSGASTSVATLVTGGLFMPTQIAAAAGGACSAEGPYGAATRLTNGFCDFSTHFTVDQTNTDPGNLWYQNRPAGVARTNSYHYSSVVGALGVNTTEQGAGTANFAPAEILLGVSAANAQPQAYSTIIYLEALSS